MGGNNRTNHLKLLNQEIIVSVHYEKLKGDKFVEWIGGLKTLEEIYLRFDAMNTHITTFIYIVFIRDENVHMYL